MRASCAVFAIGNREKDLVAYRLPGSIGPFARLRDLKVSPCHKGFSLGWVP